MLGRRRVVTLVVGCALLLFAVNMVFHSRYTGSSGDYATILIEKKACENRLRQAEMQIAQLHRQVGQQLPHQLLPTTSPNPVSLLPSPLPPSHSVAADDLLNQLLTQLGPPPAVHTTVAGGVTPFVAPVQLTTAQPGLTAPGRKADFTVPLDVHRTVPREKAPPGIAVVVLCHSRGASLTRTLNSLFENHPGAGFPVFVSQDGNIGEVVEAVHAFQANHEIFHMQYMFPNSYYSDVPPAIFRAGEKVYFRIAAHYKWALSQMFESLGYEHVIIVEDDMEFAPDFFDYFLFMKQRLDADPSVLCVSAWNDNGMNEFVQDPTQFMRTDCFPGLGWMMSATLWKELSVKWPWGFWDDWLRLPENRKDRSCIIPEVNRVYTFGNDGSSGGQFFDLLQKIRLNRVKVDYQSLDLTSLDIDAYDARIAALVASGTPVAANEAIGYLEGLPAAPTPAKPITVTYTNMGELNSILSRFKLMTDHKAGIPRGSYQGFLTFRWKQVKGTDDTYSGGYRIFLIGSKSVVWNHWKRQ